MPVNGIFITGTDTGVGKTVVTAAILSYLQLQGHKTGVMKPIETGVDRQCSSASNSDALFLMECGGIEDDLSEVCPFRLKPAASPYQAAGMENEILEPQTILSAYQRLSEKYDWMLVEGVGGVRVPITQHYGVVDLIRDLDLPVVVVSRYQLGTLNHTLLTLDTLNHNGISVKGVLFNRSKAETPDTIEEAQPRLMKELSGTRILGEFPFINNLNTESFSPDTLRELETSVHFRDWL